MPSESTNRCDRASSSSAQSSTSRSAASSRATRRSDRLGGRLALVTRRTERLEVRQVVTATVDQRHDMIEFPERLARLEAEFARLLECALAADRSTQLHRVEAADRTATAIALAYPPPRLAWIALVVAVDTGWMPAAAAVRLTSLRAVLVENRIAAPATGCPVARR